MPSRWVTEHWRSEAGTLDPDALLAHPPRVPFTLLHGAGRFVVWAEEPLAHLGAEDLAGLHWERIGEAPPPLTPDLLGFVAYEYGYRLDASLPLPPAVEDPIPDLRFTLYARVLVADRATGRLHRAVRTLPPEVETRPPALGRGSFRAGRAGDTDTPEAYAAKVTRIREEIARGNVYQVNLSRQETWAIQGGLAELARRLHAANPAPYSALVADPAFVLLSSSPESFLRWDQGLIRSRPIKGTAPRAADPARDEALARQLQASVKNRAELAMIVDLLRNDLARLCSPTVRVEGFPLLETYANVHHLVADVVGTLADPLRLESLLATLFPGGSITGCPKLAAMGLIRALEPAPRRIYCGALGWMTHDLAAGEWALPIRTAWAADDLLRFGVGGGVVWDSDPREEYEETLHKGRSLVQCLNS